MFYLQFTSFSIAAGLIDVVTAVVNQAIVPYGFPQQDAGFALAFLIFVGVAAALVVAPILDRTKAHLIATKVMVFFIAGAFTALPFVPESRSVAALYTVYALIGASSISLEPAALELQASWTHPVSPEFASVICWSGAKVVTALFTYIAGNAVSDIHVTTFTRGRMLIFSPHIACSQEVSGGPAYWLAFQRAHLSRGHGLVDCAVRIADWSLDIQEDSRVGGAWQ